MTPKIILIHPPVAKCSEPPAGIARLASCLNANAIPYETIDANLEGLLYLLKSASGNNTLSDRWTKRACKNLDRHLAAMKNIGTYQNPGRYGQAVKDINRLLNVAAKPFHVALSLTDYRDRRFSPVKSADLIASAHNPQANPFYPYFKNRLTNALRSNPDFIGLSLNYLSQALCTFAMIGFIKNIHPRQKIILGGSLVTSWMKLGAHLHTFGGLVDEIVEGAGEQKLLEILGTQNKLIHNAPAYDDFPLDQYLSPGLIIPYSGARGCYWRQCAFCPEKAEGNAYHPLEASQANAELQELTRQMNPTLIHLLDSSISPSLLQTLSQNPPGAPWYGFVRVTAHLADEDFCLSLKKSGCAMLKLGIESGDQNVLDQLHKGIDLLTASVVLKNLKKAGIATYCYFLFGTPPENENSAFTTMNFIADHRDCIDFLNLAIFNLPVRSVESDNLATHDFYAGDLSLYRNFKHPLGWHRPAVRRFLESVLKKHPAISLILKRNPVFFTSNHAPFFALNGLSHEHF